MKPRVDKPVTRGRSRHSRSAAAGGGLGRSPRRFGTLLLRLFRAARDFLRRHLIFRFVVGVFVLMAGFYALYDLEWKYDIIGGHFLPWNLRMHAEVSGAVLKLLGNEITVIDRSVISPRFSMQIVRGCDALEPLALFLSACLAFPVARRWAKVFGMVLGALCLEVTNVARMVTLFYVGVYHPKYFQMMHLEVWQAVFIVLAVAYWAIWAIWATRQRSARVSVAA